MNFVVREAEVKLPVSWIVAVLAWVTHFIVLILLLTQLISWLSFAGIFGLAYTLLIAAMATAVAADTSKRKRTDER